MDEKIKLLITTFSILLVILVVLFLYPVYTATSKLSESNYSISNVSRHAMNSIGSKPNFSIAYLEYSTYPVSTQTGYSKNNGSYYTTYSKYIYTNYSGSLVLNIAYLISPYYNASKVLTSMIENTLSGDYISCSRMNAYTLVNCTNTPPNLPYPGLEGTFLNFLNSSLQNRYYYVNGTVHTFANLSSSGTTISNSSFIGYPCQLSISHIFDAQYPNINGTSYRCISSQYGVPLLISIDLHDPYYNNVGADIILNISAIYINPKANESYFKIVTNRTELFPQSMISN